MTTLTLSAAPAASLPTDVYVVGLAAATGTGRPSLVTPEGALTAAARRRLQAALTALGATGSTGEVTKVPGEGIAKAPVVAAVGLGRAPRGRGTGWEPETVRRAAGAAVRALAGTRRVALALPVADAAGVEAVAQGALLGSYAFTAFRGTTAGTQPRPVRTVTVVVADAKHAKDKAAKAALRHAGVVAEAVCLARDLVNTPPSALPPAALAQAAERAVAGLPVEVSILSEKALRKSGFGGILAVGQGSANPPQLVTLAYRPPGAGRHLALVGKGITFDSGGLSLKPAQAMEAMKSDMGGAAAVIAAVAAIARLGLPVKVTGVVPTAENMPSGSAQRPGDVITIYGGRTVEVLNTDAEGRLILADALVFAAEQQPDLIVDAATLTGAALVALGARTAGVMGNTDDVRDAVWQAAGRAGEAMWPMPLPADLRASLDSDVADLKNIGDRNGGMLTAGLFLQEFVPTGLPWAHLDIAGPAWNEGAPFGYTPKGGTGAAVRTFVQVAETVAAGLL